LDKAPDAFRTISEVADDLDVPQHVLRFWESRFTQIRPMKRAGGRRYYRADDVDLLRGIRHLLYGEGYTIRGVQRILKEHSPKFVQNVWRAGEEQPARRAGDDSAAGEALTESPGEGEAEQRRGLRGLLPSLLGRERESDQAAQRHEPGLEHPVVQPTSRGRFSGQPEEGTTAPPTRDLFDPSGAAGSKRPRDDLRKLQAAVHELGECRRLLDTVLG
jgi:DNA-binding transcriptional MerR regulator